MPKKNVPIKYTSRSFETIKNDLVEHAKRYYPTTFKDFNESGFGSLMLDSVSYIGDVLSFYLDFQANETFIQNAAEFDNILRLAKQSGYKHRNNPSSNTVASFFILVPADSSGTAPDSRYLPVLKQGSEFSADNGAIFVLEEDVTFTNQPTAVARVNETTGVPTYYAIKSYGRVVSGVMKSTEVTLGDFKRFTKLKLNIEDVSEVVSVIDSTGHEYYEVDYLSQNTIYRSITNRDNATQRQTSMLLKPFVAARRFTADVFPNHVELQFGSGKEEDYDTDVSLDPKNVSLKVHGKSHITDQVIDPTKLIQSDNFGISPANTTITITYRQNTVDNVNVASNTMTTITNAFMEFPDELSLNSSTLDFVKSSVECTNEEPITGDAEEVTVEELKGRVLNSFAGQNRAVTQQDYVANVYAMPTKFGAVKRAAIHRDPDSLRRNMNLFVVSEDENGKLASCNQTTKTNLKTWLNKNKMINDTVDILDAKILNLGINFEVVADADKDSSQVLESCLSALKTRFASSVVEVGEDFFITDIYNTLNETEGVVDVIKVGLFKKSGSNYADISFDVNNNLSPDGRYIAIPKNVIYEIKYPNIDIKGAIK